MPIYDFECTKCGKVSEKIIRRSEDEGNPTIYCENCREFSMVKCGVQKPGLVKVEGGTPKFYGE